MKKLLSIAFATFLLTSCSKKMDEFTSTPQQFKRADSTAINESLDNAALIVATSLKDRAVRSFIKAEALKQFDGDYDILYQSAKNTAINGSTLENIFSGNMQGRFSKTNVFEKIISNVSNFQISVPVHCEEWNENNYTPLVAIAETGVNENELKPIKAYDSKGNIHWLNAQIQPDKPVIVVGISERIDETGKLKYAFESTSAADSRVNGQSTILGQIRCPDLGDIESWANGKPELRLRIYGAKLSQGSTNPAPVYLATKFYTPDRNAIDNKWYVVNTFLFHWYYDWTSPTTTYVYGSDVEFHWVEEDGGFYNYTEDVTIGGIINPSSGGILGVSESTSFTRKGDDEYIGFVTVHYTNPTSNYYYHLDDFPYSEGSALDMELD